MPEARHRRSGRGSRVAVLGSRSPQAGHPPGMCAMASSRGGQGSITREGVKPVAGRGYPLVPCLDPGMAMRRPPIHSVGGLVGVGPSGCGEAIRRGVTDRTRKGRSKTVKEECALPVRICPPAGRTKPRRRQGARWEDLGPGLLEPVKVGAGQRGLPPVLNP